MYKYKIHHASWQCKQSISHNTINHGCNSLWLSKFVRQTIKLISRLANLQFYIVCIYVLFLEYMSMNVKLKENDCAAL